MFSALWLAWRCIFCRETAYEAEEGADGGATAASPALPQDLDLSLDGAWEPQGAATPNRGVGGRYLLVPRHLDSFFGTLKRAVGEGG